VPRSRLPSVNAQQRNRTKVEHRLGVWNDLAIGTDVDEEINPAIELRAAIDLYTESKSLCMAY
jgi:hypothetical protein